MLLLRMLLCFRLPLLLRRCLTRPGLLGSVLLLLLRLLSRSAFRNAAVFCCWCCCF